jgi:hypothetical protein
MKKSNSDSNRQNQNHSQDGPFVSLDLADPNSESISYLQSYIQDPDIKKHSVKHESKENLVPQLKTLGVFLLFYTIVIYLGFIVCDIYYALNDNSCVNQDASRINLNLKTFLLVRGFALLGLIFNVMMILCIISNSLIQSYTCVKFFIGIQLGIFILTCLFLFAWNIIGAVIFWAYMDTSKCSDPVYNYIFVSLVIVFVSSGCNTLSLMTKNNTRD